MTQIISKINTRSDEFKTNAEAMQAQLRDLHEVTHTIRQGGGEAARAKHEGRGKLLARDRIDSLIDRGSNFLEIGQLAAWNMYSGDIASAGMVADRKSVV